MSDNKSDNLYIIDNYIVSEDKMDLNTSLVVPSTVNAYSIGVQYAREWFISKFPSDFFKSINIEGRNIFYDFRKMSKEQMLKRLKPALSITPQLQLDHTRDFVDSYPFGAKMFARSCNFNDSFFRDYENNLFIGLVPELMLIDFTFRVKLYTKAQQIDLYKFMQLNMRIGFSQSEFASIDYHIPYSIMLQLAKDAGFAVKDDLIVDVPAFLSYVNKHSTVPIMYKMRTINSTDEFFMRMTNTYMWISCFDPMSADDGDKDGMINTDFVIEMNCQLKMPSPKMFIYFSKERHVDIERRNAVEDVIGLYDIQTVDIPPTNKQGWNQLLTTDYFEDTKGRVLAINFKDFFRDSQLGDIIEYNNDIAISSAVCIDFLLMNNGKKLDYEMDWSTQTLTTKDVPESDITNIAIYTDMDYINKIIINKENANNSRIDK